MSRHARSARRSRQGGFSLIELSVAILIALFLIGGVLTVEQGVHTSYQDNSGLSQLEDNERFAMSLITEIVQKAGYYPNPATNNMVTALPAESTTTPQGGNAPLQGGWYLYGIDNAGSGNFKRQDSFFVRYMTAAGQNINLCDGSAGGTATYTNYFYIAVDAHNASTYDLYCELQAGTGAGWNTAVPLVNGLAGISVLYGVHTKTYNGQQDNNVDYYMNATTVGTNGDWPNVTSVQVTLKFINPLYQRVGQPHYVNFTRVIAVMDRTGQEFGP